MLMLTFLFAIFAASFTIDHDIFLLDDLCFSYFANSVLHLSLRFKDRFWLRFPCGSLKSLIIRWDQINLQEIFENILCKKLPVN